jgi:hypothetical protein
MCTCDAHVDGAQPGYPVSLVPCAVVIRTPVCRPLLLVVMLGVGLAATARRFVAPATRDDRELSYEQLTALIADCERARAEGVDVTEWLARDRDLNGIWEYESAGSLAVVLGRLYARRSYALVRDVRYVSCSWTMLAFFAVEPIRGDPVGGSLLAGFMGLPMAALMAPIDLVGGPIWLTSAIVNDLRVPHEDLVGAAQDLEHARELGFTDQRVMRSGQMALPKAYHNHLDILGYDAAWLRSHGR